MGTSTLERLEGCNVRFTLNVSAEQFEEGIQHTYMEQRGRIAVQGFRKGKAPRKLIEARYGKGVFYEDALDYLLPSLYDEAIDEHDARVVARPHVTLISAEAGVGAVLTVDTVVEPDVRVDDYSGIEYETPDVSVTDEMVDEEIQKQLRRGARILPVEGRALKLEDTANINFEGFTDGVAFEGGKGENYPLLLGSHNFIDTFEEQIVGHEIGDSFEVNVRFPDDYNTPSLAGKDAMFKVKINSATYREVPEADDEFAQDTSDFDTFAEYKEDVRKKIEEARKAEGEHVIETRVLEKLADRAVMDVPDVMYDNEVDNMVADLQRRVRGSGMPYEQYLAYAGLTPVGLREQYRADAERNVRARLALQAVAVQGGFEASDEEVEHEITLMAQNYGMEPKRMRESMSPRDFENMRRDVQVQKAMKKVVSLAVEKK